MTVIVMRDVRVPVEGEGVQLELPGVSQAHGLRQAFAWLLESLDCTYWTRKMHADHGRLFVEGSILGRKKVPPFYGDVDVRTLKLPQLRAYIDAEKRRGVAKETIRKRLSSLKMALREAVAHGVMERLPEWPVIRGDVNVKDAHWTRTQWEAVHLACDEDDMRTWIAMGWWLGLHTYDLNRYRWCDVDLVTGTWERRNHKTKIKPAVLPLPDRLLAILRERFEAKQPHKRDLIAGNLGNPNRPLRAIAERAEVPRISPIGLRHSCATYLAEVGSGEMFSMHWMGLKTEQPLKRHYRHVTTPTVDATIAAINAGEKKSAV